MPSEEIITQLRAMGTSAYVSAMRSAGESVYQLEGHQSRAAIAARNFGERLDNLASSTLRAGGKIAGLAAVTGASAAKIGLQFDAMMERSQIGIETLVGNAAQSKKIMGEVRDFALKAPLFGVEQMMKTSQQLIGAGYDAKNVVPYLETFSDTLSAMGRRPEDLQRLTYAFVQMMSKGQISAEELRGQLGEIFPAQKILAREMGLTTDEFAKKMKKGSIKGKDSILLLLRGMERDFGGATDKMSKTFDGQLANIRESAKYTLGIVMMPLFKHLEKDVFPTLQMFGDHWRKIMSDNTLTTEQKWEETKRLANAWLKPMINDIGRWLDDMDIGQKIADGVNAALPIIMSNFGHLGAEATKAFAKAWWESDTWGKLFVGFLLISKLVGWKTLFGMIGRRAGAEFAKKAAESAAASEAMGAAGTKSGGKFGRAFGAAAKLATAAALADLAITAGKWLDQQDWYKKMSKKMPWDPNISSWLPKTDKKHPWLGKQAPIVKAWDKVSGAAQSFFDPSKWMPRRQHGGPVVGGSPYVVGEAGPELFVPGASGSIKPSLGGFVIHNYMELDGRIVSQSVARHNASEMARK